MQVKDQAFSGGNLALRRSHETGTPVRVFRGSKADGKLKYTYEGLYNVAEAKLAVRPEWERGEGKEEGEGEGRGRGYVCCCLLRPMQTCWDTSSKGHGQSDLRYRLEHP